jgi:hypothetical protein
VTDEQLAKYLCISDDPMRDAVIKALSPAKRATYERMASIETELELWQAGLGPKPNVLIDTERSTRRRRHWR